MSERSKENQNVEEIMYCTKKFLMYLVVPWSLNSTKKTVQLYRVGNADTGSNFKLW